jgi:hypothetical protein
MAILPENVQRGKGTGNTEPQKIKETKNGSTDDKKKMIHLLILLSLPLVTINKGFHTRSKHSQTYWNQR